MSYGLPLFQLRRGCYVPWFYIVKVGPYSCLLFCSTAAVAAVSFKLPLLGLLFLLQCLDFLLQRLFLLNKLAVFVFLHRKQIRFVSSLSTIQHFWTGSGYVYPPVGADLDFKLCVKEFAVLEKVLKSIEQ